MAKQTIINLIKAVNSKLKNKTLSNMLVGKVNTYHTEGISEGEIFNKIYADVAGMNESLKNEEITAILEEYSQHKYTEKFTIKNLANEAGLFKLLTGIRASNAFADPIVKTAVGKIEESLSSQPEFRVLPTFIEGLKGFSYDSTIKNAVTEAQVYIEKNANKLVLLNAIYEFKLVPTKTYTNTIAILEQALLDNQYSVDTIKMKLRDSINMPAVKKMVNNLSIVEGRMTSSFNLGVGTNLTNINALVAPSIVTKDRSIITILDNKFVDIKENEVKFIEPKYVFENHLDFYNYCINFSKLGFAANNDGVSAKFRNTNIEFKNEGTSVAAYINNKKIDSAKSVNYTNLFIMENIGTKNMVSMLFENSKYITSLDFVKNIVTPTKSCSVISINEKLFVIENDNSGRIYMMTAPQFVKFVKENYDHDTTALFSDELDNHSNSINSIDDQKRVVNDDILKLEASLAEIDESLTQTEDEEIVEQMTELRFRVEKTINELRDKYVSLDSEKTALLEHNILSTTKKYKLDDSVKTIDGRHGKVRGVDTSTGRYMVAFEDNRVLPIKENELV